MGLRFHKEQDQQMIHYTVEAILKGLKNSDNELLRYVYKKYYPEIRFFVIKNSGTNEDAKDVFQEALIVIYKKLQDDMLDLTCSFKTYIYSVARIVWLRHLEKRKIATSELSENQIHIELNDGLDGKLEEQERFKLYQTHFLTLHKDCQAILRMFLEKVPMKEIQKRMNLKSEKYAKKRKYQCKEILVKKIQNDPNYKQLKNER
ncbi:MAG: sigma-70 family RNA polymerase sigma factor [Bacteroidetes bacterium]|nr:sigma-70 family RNA polymerase sigma factor [Bacteroidota bacterium]